MYDEKSGLGTFIKMRKEKQEKTEIKKNNAMVKKNKVKNRKKFKRIKQFLGGALFLKEPQCVDLKCSTNIYKLSVE